MGEGTWNFVGHTVRADELELIRSIVQEFDGLSRVELASTVCELLGWTRVTGRLKARECRDLLERLAARNDRHRRCSIGLSTARSSSRSRARPILPTGREAPRRPDCLAVSHHATVTLDRSRPPNSTSPLRLWFCHTTAL